MASLWTLPASAWWAPARRPHPHPALLLCALAALLPSCKTCRRLLCCCVQSCHARARRTGHVCNQAPGKGLAQASLVKTQEQRSLHKEFLHGSVQVSADYLLPVSTLIPTSGVVLRTTFRVWDMTNMSIISTYDAGEWP